MNYKDCDSCPTKFYAMYEKQTTCATCSMCKRYPDMTMDRDDDIARCPKCQKTFELCMDDWRGDENWPATCPDCEHEFDVELYVIQWIKSPPVITETVKEPTNET